MGVQTVVVIISWLKFDGLFEQDLFGGRLPMQVLDRILDRDVPLWVLGRESRCLFEGLLCFRCAFVEKSPSTFADRVGKACAAGILTVTRIGFGQCDASRDRLWLFRYPSLK